MYKIYDGSPLSNLSQLCNADYHFLSNIFLLYGLVLVLNHNTGLYVEFTMKEMGRITPYIVSPKSN